MLGRLKVIVPEGLSYIQQDAVVTTSALKTEFFQSLGGEALQNAIDTPSGNEIVESTNRRPDHQ
jgi:hypothetical protein